MSDIKFVIPTYNRYEEIQSKTLTTLKEGGVPSEQIYIFVANEEEKEKYEKSTDNTYYNEIIVGELGIRQQRIFISKYFPVGERICSMDDDVEQVIKKVQGELHKVENIYKLVESCFKTLRMSEFEGINIWGVYPTPNCRWMKESYITTDLRFCIGVMFGYINRHDEELYASDKCQTKSDIEQSILYYIKDKGIARFNDICFKTKFKAKGGIGKDRYAQDKVAQEYLCQTYPMICSPKFRNDGSPEVVVKRNPKLPH